MGWGKSEHLAEIGVGKLQEIQSKKRKIVEINTKNKINYRRQMRKKTSNQSRKVARVFFIHIFL